MNEAWSEARKSAFTIRPAFVNQRIDMDRSRFTSSFSILPDSPARNVRIEPGGSSRITYDCIDGRIYVSEIVVRDAKGEHRQVVVDRFPPRDSHVIKNWEYLSPPAPNVLAAAHTPDRSAERRNWQLKLWGLIAIGVVVPIVYHRLWSAYSECCYYERKRGRRKRQTSGCPS